MKIIGKLTTVFVLLGLFGLAFILRPNTVNAQTQQSPQQSNQEQSNNQNSTQSQPIVYQYVAQPGDSYSLMARKAIQTYGITAKVNLSEAQIIYAETNLTQDAGSPVLLKGQKVEIKEDAVKNWVEKAQKLSKAQQAAWNVYAQNANFNTNAVGQAS